MITGHIGIANAASAASRMPPRNGVYAALVAAAFAPDVADVLYALAGICSPYGLYSHTIHAAILEAALIGGAAWLATGSPRLTAAFVTVILLHVPADYFTGHKLIIPGGDVVGLRLYWWPMRDFLLETPLAVAGWLLLRRSGRGPAWGRGIAVLVTMFVLQSGFDIVAELTTRSMKPNACTRSKAEARTVWTARAEGTTLRVAPPISAP